MTLAIAPLAVEPLASSGEIPNMIVSFTGLTVLAAVFNIDVEPASMTRGSTGSFTVSNPAVTPTVGNTTITSGTASLQIDSVTGTGPYVINFTVQNTLNKQHDATGYVWTVTVAAENDTSAAIPLNEPAGWDYTDLVNPVTTSGSILNGYTGDAPVTGDQVVYTTPTSPDSIGFTVEADGNWVLDSTPVQNQTVTRYVIQANGTVGTSGVVTYSVGGPASPATKASNEEMIGFFRTATGLNSYNFNELAIAYYKQVSGSSLPAFNDVLKGAQDTVPFVGLAPVDWRNL